MSILDYGDATPQPAYSHPLLAELIFAFDKHLQRRQGVFEYSPDPQCIFRIQIGPCDRALRLHDGTQLRPADRVVRLHFWNEHMPSTQQHSNPIDWAREMCWRIEKSLFELASYLDDQSDLCDIDAICGDVVTAVREESGRISRIMQRYGFETFHDPRPLRSGGRLGRLGENILISLIVFAQNADTLRKDTLRRVRVPIYLSRRELRRRFGRAAGWQGRRA